MTDNSQSSKTQKQSFNEKRKEAEVLQTYISTLGLSIQFVLLAAGSGFWFNIKRDYLQLHETDVPLKFPVVISGTWNILGIIDALPRDHFSVEHLDRVGADEHVPSMIGPLATLIGTSAIMFGRRLDSHGLKPLAIYRELSIPE